MTMILGILGFCEGMLLGVLLFVGGIVYLLKKGSSNGAIHRGAWMLLRRWRK